jgi:hypothetical protein
MSDPVLAKVEATVERIDAGVTKMGERVLSMEGALSSLDKHSRDTATASMRLAAIAEERFRADQADRERQLRREELTAEHEREVRNKVLTWLGENYKMLGLGLILIFNPASIGKLYELGLLAPLGLGAPAPMAAAAAAPIPQPVHVPGPVAPAESNP